MRRKIGSSLAALAIAALLNMPCRADGLNADEPSFEVYTEGDCGGHAGGINSSAVWGVFSPVTQPGFRLKLDGSTNLSGNVPLFTNGFVANNLKTVSDLMAGYQLKYSSIWIRLYAGAAYGTQFGYLSGNGITGRDKFGAAAAFQTFWPVSGRLSASLNGTWLQPDDSMSFYFRSAYEIYRRSSGLAISAGGEASLSSAGAGSPYSQRTCHNQEGFECYDRYGRGGALLNLRYGANDLTLSAGVSQAYGNAGIGPYASTGPYASISYGRQF